MEMTFLLLLAINLAVSALILAIGMGATVTDVVYLWRRPGLLLRSLLAMYVAVPLAAYLIVALWPLTPGGKAALLVLAVSAGAPTLPRKLSGIEEGAYVFSLTVTSSLLAIVMVPSWIALLAWHFGLDTALPAKKVAAVIAKAFLLPLCAGMAIRHWAPAFSTRMTDRLVAASELVLALAGAVLLALQWRILLDFRWHGMAALLMFMASAVAIGHAMGGPREDDRTTLAITCATRHIGIAMIVASTFRGPKTLVLIAAYSLATIAISVPYLRWRGAKASAGSDGA